LAIRFPRDKAINAENSEPFKLVDYRHWEILEAGPELDKPGDTEKGDKKVVALVAYGAMVNTGVKVLQALKGYGLEATLINGRSCKPLDKEMLTTLLNRTESTIFTLEEGGIAGGFGSAILEFAAQLKARYPKKQLACVYPVGVPDEFVEHGARSILLDKVGLTAEKISKFILKTMQVQ
jgi:1-deoxy-D-xylulose-5-phosphate synthase